MDDTKINSTSCEKKNSLYVKWKTTPVTHVSYDTAKQRFKSCEKDILKQIQIAKSNYFNRIFTAYQTNMKKHGALLMKP